MKLSLKSQSKATVAGLIGFALPALLLKNYHPFDTTLLIAGAVFIANAAGYYQGATNAEAAIYAKLDRDTECDSCDIGPNGHEYDCPEAQE